MLLQQEQVQNRFSILDILILYLLVFMVESILFQSFCISTGACLPMVDMILFAFSFLTIFALVFFVANIVFVYSVLNPHLVPTLYQPCTNLVPTLYQTRCAKFAADFCRRYGGRQCFVGQCRICFWVGRRAGAAVQCPASQRRVLNRQGDALTHPPAGLQYASLARLWSRSTRLLRRAPAASSDARDGL